MEIIFKIAFIVFSYLLGAIPFGYILTRHYTGKNIMTTGSKNIGSTNVRRVAGKKIAIITQLLDMLKGLLPVLFYLYLTKDNPTSDFFIYFVALASIIGHDFSIFLKLKGGKGVNTTLGASLLLAPFSVLVSVLFYFIVKWRFQYVSLGSLTIAITLPLSEFILHQTSPTFYYLFVCSMLIFFLHRENINRLLQNQEFS